MSLNIVIRADASSDIGIGHVMRCLTLAKELQRQGANVLFVCKDHPGNLSVYIRRLGYSVSVISTKSNREKLYQHSSWLGGGEIDDAEQTIAASRREFGSRVDLVIVDHYGIARPWEIGLRSITSRIVVIDDLSDRLHDCDLLICPTFGRTVAAYGGLVNYSCELLVGERFIILRQEFLDYSEKVVTQRRLRMSPDRLKILIMMGGTDPDNITLKAVKAVESQSKVATIDIVLSSFSTHIGLLQEYLQQRKDITLHVSPESVAELLYENDLAIGAAGGSSWERCRMGLPSILNVNADNQIDIARNLVDRKVCFKIEPDNFSESISNFLENMALKSNYLRAVKNSLAVCDGLGVQRITEKIFHYA